VPCSFVEYRSNQRSELQLARLAGKVLLKLPRNLQVARVSQAILCHRTHVWVTDYVF
jgi:hypothetical protein